MQNGNKNRRQKSFHKMRRNCMKTDSYIVFCWVTTDHFVHEFKTVRVQRHIGLLTW